MLTYIPRIAKLTRHLWVVICVVFSYESGEPSETYVDDGMECISYLKSLINLYHLPQHHRKPDRNSPFFYQCVQKLWTRSITYQNYQTERTGLATEAHL